MQVTRTHAARIRAVRRAYGASGPPIGVRGLAIGPRQTVGSVAAIGGGVEIGALR